MIQVNIFKKVKIAGLDKLVKEAVLLAAKKEKKIKGELDVVIVGDGEIKELNRVYRGKNKITDVLSFAWQEDDLVPTEMLGQIYICYPQIKRQAKIWDVTIKEEFVRMLVHGLLHLVGYDHDSDQKTKKMFDLQEKIIQSVL